MLKVGISLPYEGLLVVNASAENASDPDRPSQYSLAAMFYITTLMALVFSATAPFFRAINAENRIAILVYGGFQIVCLLLYLFGFMSSRLRAVLLTDKGELVYRTTFMEQGSLGFWRSLQALWTTVPAMLILMAAGICITSQPESVAVFLNPFVLAIQVFAIREAVRSTLSLYYGVDNRDLEVFQSGLVSVWRLPIPSLECGEVDPSCRVRYQCIDVGG